MPQQDQKLFSLNLPISLSQEQKGVSKKAEIKESLVQSMNLYESLFECLASDQSFSKKANTLRHPLIFYYGHTAVFYINKLVAAGYLREGVNPRLESMLAIGVDEMSWDDLDEKNYDWPSPRNIIGAYSRVKH